MRRGVLFESRKASEKGDITFRRPTYLSLMHHSMSVENCNNVARIRSGVELRVT